jgi:hypothetical protein
MRGTGTSPLAALVVAVCVSPSAWASGGLSCTIGDASVAAEVQAGVTRGMGSPIFSFAGTLSVKANGLGADLAKTTFEQDHVAQYWLDGEELRLLLYRERMQGEHAYVQLDIRTTSDPDEESTYSGAYSLSAYEGAGGGEGRTFEFDGKVECFVE